MGSEGDATSHSHLRTHPPTVHYTTMAQTDGTMLDLASTLVELAPRLVSGNGNGLGQLSSLLRSNDAAVCAAASMRALATGRRAIRRQGDSGVDLRTGVSQLVELMQDSAAPSEGRVAATWALAALNESSRAVVVELAMEGALQQLTSGNEAEQEAAAMLVGTMAEGDEETARLIAERGGVAALARLLAGFGNGKKRAASEALQALIALKPNTSEQLKRVVLEIGALKALIAMASSDDRFASKEAQKLLVSALRMVPGSVKQVGEAGGTQAAIKLLCSTHTEDHHSSSEAAHLLGLLLLEGGEKARAEVVAAPGALRAVVDAIRPDSEGVLPNASATLMAALKPMATTPAHIPRLLLAGLPERIVEMLWSEGQSGSGLSLALDLAGALASTCANAALALREEGVVGLLLGTLQPAAPLTRWWLDGQEHEDSVVYPGAAKPEVAVGVLNVLGFLTRQADEEGLEDIINTGTVLALVAELRLMASSPPEPSNAEVSSLAVRILSQLAPAREVFTAAMRECQGARILLEALPSLSPFNAAQIDALMIALSSSGARMRDVMRELRPEQRRTVASVLAAPAAFPTVRELLVAGGDGRRAVLEVTGLDCLVEALRKDDNESALGCLEALADDATVSAPILFTSAMLSALAGELQREEGRRMRVLKLLNSGLEARTPLAQGWTAEVEMAPLAGALTGCLEGQPALAVAASQVVCALAPESRFAKELLGSGGLLKLLRLQGVAGEERAAAAARALLALSVHRKSRALIESHGLGPLVAMLHVVQQEREVGGVARVLRMLVTGLGAAEVVAGAGGIQLCIALLLELQSPGTGSREYAMFAEAASILEQLSAVGPDARAAIVSSGGVLALTAFSIDCAGRRDWEGLACSACALRRLAVSQEVTAALADAGAVTPLLHLLTEAKGLVGHRGRLAALETILSLSINPDIRPAIADDSAKMAVQVLETHCNSSGRVMSDECSDEAEVAASILSSIALTGQAERHMIAAAGGLELLTRALQYGGHLEDSAASALRILAVEEDLQAIICELPGGAEASVLLSQRAASMSTPPLSARSLIRGNLSSTSASDKTLHSARGIDILVGMLRHGSGLGRKVAAEALHFLGDNEEHREHIIEEDGVSALLELLLTNRADDEAEAGVVARKIAAARALNRLSCLTTRNGEWIASKVASTGGKLTTVLSSILGNSDASETGRIAAAELIGKVAELGMSTANGSSGSVPLPGAASISPLLDILATGSTNNPSTSEARSAPPLVVASVQALSCLALHEGSRQSMLSQGAAATLLVKLAPPPREAETEVTEDESDAHAAMVVASSRCLMRLTSCEEGQKMVVAHGGVDTLAAVVYGGWAPMDAVADSAAALENLAVSAKATALAISCSRDSSMLADESSYTHSVGNSALKGGRAPLAQAMGVNQHPMANLSVGSNENMFWSDILGTTAMTELGGHKRPSDGSNVEEVAAHLAAADLSQAGLLGDSSVIGHSEERVTGVGSSKPPVGAPHRQRGATSGTLAAASVGREVLCFENNSFDVDLSKTPREEDTAPAVLGQRRGNSFYSNELSQLDCSDDSMPTAQALSGEVDAASRPGDGSHTSTSVRQEEVEPMSISAGEEEGLIDDSRTTSFKSCVINTTQQLSRSNSAATLGERVECSDIPASNRMEAAQDSQPLPDLLYTESEPAATSVSARQSLDAVRISVEPWLSSASPPHRVDTLQPLQPIEAENEDETFESLNETDSAVFCFPPTASPPASSHRKSGDDDGVAEVGDAAPKRGPESTPPLLELDGDAKPGCLRGERRASSPTAFAVDVSEAEEGEEMPPLLQGGSDSPTASGKKRRSSASTVSCKTVDQAAVESCSTWLAKSRDWSPGELPRISPRGAAQGTETPAEGGRPAVPTLRVDQIPAPDISVSSDTEDEDAPATMPVGSTTFRDSLQTTFLESTMMSAVDESFLADGQGEDEGQEEDGLGPRAPLEVVTHTPRCLASSKIMDESDMGWRAGGGLREEDVGSLAHMMLTLEMNTSLTDAGGLLNSTAADENMSMTCDATDLSICSAVPGTASAISSRLLGGGSGPEDWRSALLGGLPHVQGAEGHVRVLQMLLHCIADPEAGRHTAISARDSLPAVVALLWHGTPAGRQLAARTISSLAAEEPNIRNAVVEEPGCLHGLAELLGGGYEMETRELAAAAFCCLSWAEEHRLRIGGVPAIPGLVHLVRSGLRKGADAAVRAAGGALSNLALSPALHAPLLAAGSVKHLTACLKSSKPAVRAAGAHALKALAVDEAAGLAIVEAGALKYLVLDLGNMQEQGLAVAAAACIRNLMLSDKHASALEAIGGVKALATLIGKVSLFRMQGEVSWLDEAAQEAAGALQNAAASVAVARALVGGVETTAAASSKSQLLVMLFEAEKAAATGVRESLAGMLYNLAGSPMGRSGIVAQGGLGVLLRLLDPQTNGAGPCAAESAAGAIGLLATSEPEVRAKLSRCVLNRGLVSSLLAVVVSPGTAPDSSEYQSLRRTATDSLAALAWLDGVTSYMTSGEGATAMEAVLRLLRSSDLTNVVLGALLIPPLSSVGHCRRALRAASSPGALLDALKRGGEPGALLGGLLALAVDEAGQEAVLRAAADNGAVSMALSLLLAPATAAIPGVRDSAAGLLARLAALPAGRAALLEPPSHAVHAALALFRAPSVGSLQRAAVATLLARLATCPAGCEAIADDKDSLATLEAGMCDESAAEGIREAAGTVLMKLIARSSLDPRLWLGVAEGTKECLIRLLSSDGSVRLKLVAAGLVAALVAADSDTAQLLLQQGVLPPLLSMLPEGQHDAVREVGVRAISALVHVVPSAAVALTERSTVEALLDMMLSFKVAVAMSAGTCLKELSRPNSPLAAPVAEVLGDEDGLHALCEVAARGCSDAKELAVGVIRNLLLIPNSRAARTAQNDEVFLETLASLISGSATAGCSEAASECVRVMVETHPEGTEDVSGGGVMEAVVMAVMSEDAEERARVAAALALRALLSDAHVCARVAECEGHNILLEVASGAQGCPASVACAVMEALVILIQQPGLLSEHKCFSDTDALRALIGMLSPSEEGGRAGTGAAAPAARLLVELLVLPEVQAAWVDLDTAAVAVRLLSRDNPVTEAERQAAVTLLAATVQWTSEGLNHTLQVEALDTLIDATCCEGESPMVGHDAASLLLKLAQDSAGVRNRLLSSSGAIQKMLRVLGRAAEDSRDGGSSHAIAVSRVLACLASEADAAVELVGGGGADGILSSMLSCATLREDGLALLTTLLAHPEAASALRGGACYLTLHQMASDTSGGSLRTRAGATLSLIVCGGNGQVDSCVAAAAAAVEQLLGGEVQEGAKPGQTYGLWLVEPLMGVMGALEEKESAVVRMALSTMAKASRPAQLVTLLLSAIRYRGGGADGRAASATVLDRVLRYASAGSQGRRVAEELVDGMDVLVALVGDISPAHAMIGIADSPAHAGACALITLLESHPPSIATAIANGAPQAAAALLATVPLDSPSALSAAQLLFALASASKDAALSATRLSALPRLINLLGDEQTTGKDNALPPLPHRAGAASALIAIVAAGGVEGPDGIGDAALARLARALNAVLSSPFSLPLPPSFPPIGEQLLAGLCSNPVAAEKLMANRFVSSILVEHLTDDGSGVDNARAVLTAIQKGVESAEGVGAAVVASGGVSPVLRLLSCSTTPMDVRATAATVVGLLAGSGSEAARDIVVRDAPAALLKLLPDAEEVSLGALERLVACDGGAAAMAASAVCVTELLRTTRLRVTEKGGGGSGVGCLLGVLCEVVKVDAGTAEKVCGARDVIHVLVTVLSGGGSSEAAARLVGALGGAGGEQARALAHELAKQGVLPALLSMLSRGSEEGGAALLAMVRENEAVAVMAIEAGLTSHLSSGRMTDTETRLLAAVAPHVPVELLCSSGMLHSLGDLAVGAGNEVAGRAVMTAVATAPALAVDCLVEGHLATVTLAALHSSSPEAVVGAVNALEGALALDATLAPRLLDGGAVQRGVLLLRSGGETARCGAARLIATLLVECPPATATALRWVLLRAGGAAELLRLPADPSAPPTTVAAALKAIRALSATDDGSRHLLMPDALAHVILTKFLTRHLETGAPASTAACEDATAALGMLLSHRAVGADQSASALKVIIRGLKSTSSPSALQRASACALGSLAAIGADAARAVTKAGGVKALVRCLMAPPSSSSTPSKALQNRNSPDVKVVAAAALATMAAASPELRISVARCGGVEALVGALGADTVALRAAAAEAVATLTASNDVRRHVSRCSGAVPSLVSVMTDSDVSEGGRMGAAVAIAKLACLKEHPILRAVAEAGGLQPAAGILLGTPGHESLVRAMAKGPLVEALKDMGQVYGATCRIEVAGALARLAQDASARKAAVEAGAVPRVVAMLGRSATAERDAAALALRSLSLDERGRLEAIRCGATRPLVEALKGGSSSQDAALGTLRSLSLLPAGATEALKAGVVEAIIAVLSRTDANGGSNTPRKMAADVLGNLGTTQMASDLIQRSGALKPLVAMLELGSVESSTDAAVAAGAIGKLATCKSTRTAIAGMPAALESLVGLLRSGRPANQAAAAGAVSKLAVDSRARDAFVKLGALALLKELQASTSASVVSSAAARAIGMLAPV